MPYNLIIQSKLNTQHSGRFENLTAEQVAQKLMKLDFIKSTYAFVDIEAKVLTCGIWVFASSPFENIEVNRVLDKKMD
jgi:hypothetical protein